MATYDQNRSIIKLQQWVFLGYNSKVILGLVEVNIMRLQAIWLLTIEGKAGLQTDAKQN